MDSQLEGACPVGPYHCLMGTGPIQGDVFEVARRLGHHWVGPEHGVIAILHAAADDPARRALELCGFDGAAFEAHYGERIERDRAQSGDVEDEPGGRPNPAWYAMWGRAEGFSHALGTGTVQPVDLLLALLWDNRDWLSTRQFDVARETVVVHLRDLGVRIPDHPMPDLDRPFVNPQRVDFPLSAMDQVIAVLVERHPPGAELRWGINHDGKDAGWAFAEEGIDLQGIVRQVLESAEPSPDGL